MGQRKAPAAVLKLDEDQADLVVAALRDWADAEEDADDGVDSDVVMARMLANRVEKSLSGRKRLAERNERARQPLRAAPHGTVTSRARFATEADEDDPDLVTILL